MLWNDISPAQAGSQFALKASVRGRSFITEYLVGSADEQNMFFHIFSSASRNLVVYQLKW